jgi:hypothetical protein
MMKMEKRRTETNKVPSPVSYYTTLAINLGRKKKTQQTCSSCATHTRKNPTPLMLKDTPHLYTNICGRCANSVPDEKFIASPAVIYLAARIFDLFIQTRSSCLEKGAGCKIHPLRATASICN